MAKELHQQSDLLWHRAAWVKRCSSNRRFCWPRTVLCTHADTGL